MYVWPRVVRHNSFESEQEATVGYTDLLLSLLLWYECRYSRCDNTISLDDNRQSRSVIEENHFS